MKEVLMSFWTLQKVKLASFSLIVITLLSLSGCAKSTEIQEDGVNMPFSAGPVSAPNITPPTTNPPINE